MIFYEKKPCFAPVKRRDFYIIFKKKV